MHQPFLEFQVHQMNFQSRGLSLAREPFTGVRSGRTEGSGLPVSAFLPTHLYTTVPLSITFTRTRNDCSRADAETNKQEEAGHRGGGWHRLSTSSGGASQSHVDEAGGQNEKTQTYRFFRRDTEKHRARLANEEDLQILAKRPSSNRPG